MKFLYVLFFAALTLIADAAAQQVSPPPAPSAQKDNVQNVSTKAFIEMVSSYDLVKQHDSHYTFDDVINATSLLSYIAGVADTLGVHPIGVTLSDLTEKVVEQTKNIRKHQTPNEIVISVLKTYPHIVSSKAYFREDILIDSLRNFKKVSAMMSQGPTATTLKSWIIVFSTLSYTDAAIETNANVLQMNTITKKNECVAVVNNYLLDMLNNDDQLDDLSTPANQIINKVCY